MKTKIQALQAQRAEQVAKIDTATAEGLAEIRKEIEVIDGKIRLFEDEMARQAAVGTPNEPATPSATPVIDVNERDMSDEVRSEMSGVLLRSKVSAEAGEAAKAQFVRKYGQDNYTRAYAEGIGSTGGVLVDAEYSQTVKRRKIVPSALVSKVDTKYIRSDSYVDKRWVETESATAATLPHGVTITEVGETGSAVETSATAEGVKFSLGTFAAYKDISRNLILDTKFDLVAELSTMINESIDYKLEQLCVNGNSSAFTGIMNSSAVGYVASGSSGNITSDMIMKADTTLEYAEGFEWYLSRFSPDFAEIKVLQDLQDRYLFMQNGGISEANPSTLNGYPIVNVRSLKTASAAHTTASYASGGFGFIGNAAGYTLVRHQVMELDVLDQDAQLRTSGQVRILATFRAAGNVMMPGMLKKLSKAAS